MNFSVRLQAVLVLFCRNVCNLFGESDRNTKSVGVPVGHFMVKLCPVELSRPTGHHLSACPTTCPLVRSLVPCPLNWGIIWKSWLGYTHIAAIVTCYFRTHWVLTLRAALVDGEALKFTQFGWKGAVKYAVTYRSRGPDYNNPEAVAEGNYRNKSRSGARNCVSAFWDLVDARCFC